MGCPVSKTTGVLFSGIICLLLASGVNAQFASGLISGNWKARDLVIPFFIGTEQKPSLVVRAQKVYTDYERKGFFRIGVLPVGIMEGVTFDLRNLTSLTNSLARLHRWLGPGAVNRIEFRKATIQVSATLTNRLQAGRIRVLPGGKLELLDGVFFDTGTNHVQAMRATLQVAGEQTGMLVMATTPPWTTNFFSPTPSDPLTK